MGGRPWEVSVSSLAETMLANCKIVQFRGQFRLLPGGVEGDAGQPGPLIQLRRHDEKRGGIRGDLARERASVDGRDQIGPALSVVFEADRGRHAGTRRETDDADPLRVYPVVGGVRTHPGHGRPAVVVGHPDGRRAVGPGGFGIRVVRSRFGQAQHVPEGLFRGLGKMDQPVFQHESGDAPFGKPLRNVRTLG